MKPLGFTYCEFENETYFAIYQELLTEDFQFVSARRTMNKQEALDWTAEGGNETIVDNLEVLHETDRYLSPVTLRVALWDLLA